MEDVYDGRTTSDVSIGTTSPPSNRSSRNDHCYDSYYAVYTENEEEYFADDNPLPSSSPKNPGTMNRKFSGLLGTRIRKSLLVGAESDIMLLGLTGM